MAFRLFMECENFYSLTLFNSDTIWFSLHKKHYQIIEWNYSGQNLWDHGLRTPREEIPFTARPKTQSQSQIFRYGGSIFCLPHRTNFPDIFDLCLHWVSVVRGITPPLLQFSANIKEDSPLTAAAAERWITKARLCMDIAWTLKNIILCTPSDSVMWICVARLPLRSLQIQLTRFLKTANIKEDSPLTSAAAA